MKSLGLDREKKSCLRQCLIFVLHYLQAIIVDRMRQALWLFITAQLHNTIKLLLCYRSELIDHHHHHHHQNTYSVSTLQRYLKVVWERFPEQPSLMASAKDHLWLRRRDFFRQGVPDAGTGNRKGSAADCRELDGWYDKPTGIRRTQRRAMLETTVLSCRCFRYYYYY